MPIVRFQLTALECTRTEDRGLLDSRSEDEVYIHGGVFGGGTAGSLLVGAPQEAPEAPFAHLKVRDGERVSLGNLPEAGWAAEMPEDGHVVIGLAVHEEDADRKWPSAESLRNDIARAVDKIVSVATLSQRDPDATDLAAASTGVMRSQERFQLDDFLGKLLEKVAVADLHPSNFERSVRLAGGSRVLATDFEYTLSYRVSRDDREYMATPGRSEPLAVAMLPGTETSLSVSFLNSGRAVFLADDVILLGSPELDGWISAEAENVTLSENAAGFLLSEVSAKPGETLRFSLPIAAPPFLGRASYALRLFVPSLNYYVPLEPVHLELSSGRTMVVQVETVARNAGLGAEVRVVARDAETQEILDGTVKSTGQEQPHRTSEVFNIHSNLRHLFQTPTQKGRDQIVWPFGSVEVDGYWPQLITIRPS